MLRPARAESVAALAALMAGPLPVHFIAGGTDRLVAGRQLPSAGWLANLSAIPELAGIDCSKADTRIGGGTTVAAIETDVALRKRLAALAQAADECGSVQIRNRATLAGNIANAAPSADLVPVLVLAGARLEVVMPGGLADEIELEAFEPGMLIVSVILPGASLLPRSAFAKLGARRELTISRLNMAGMAEFDDDRFGEIRLVAGALGPRPLRLTRAEAALAGKALSPALLRDFLEMLSGEVDAAIPARVSRQWKRRAIRGLGLDVAARLCGLSPRDRLFDEVC